MRDRVDDREQACVGAHRRARRPGRDQLDLEHREGAAEVGRHALEHPRLLVGAARRVEQPGALERLCDPIGDLERVGLLTGVERAFLLVRDIQHAEHPPVAAERQHRPPLVVEQLAGQVGEGLDQGIRRSVERAGPVTDAARDRRVLHFDRHRAPRVALAFEPAQSGDRDRSLVGLGQAERAGGRLERVERLQEDGVGHFLDRGRRAERLRHAIETLGPGAATAFGGDVGAHDDHAVDVVAGTAQRALRRQDGRALDVVLDPDRIGAREDGLVLRVAPVPIDQIELAVGASDRGTGRDAERRAHRVVRDQVAAGTILHAERHAHPFGDRRQQRFARSHQRLGGPLGGHLERGAEERPRDDAGLQRVALVVDRRVRAVVATQAVLGGERLVAPHRRPARLERVTVVGVHAAGPSIAHRLRGLAGEDPGPGRADVGAARLGVPQPHDRGRALEHVRQPFRREGFGRGGGAGCGSLRHREVPILSRNARRDHPTLRPGARFDARWPRAGHGPGSLIACRSRSRTTR